MKKPIINSLLLSFSAPKSPGLKMICEILVRTCGSRNYLFEGHHFPGSSAWRPSTSLPSAPAAARSVPAPFNIIDCKDRRK